MSKLDYKTVLEQEKERLRIFHPTPADIPSCMSAFDDYLACGAIRSQIKALYRYGGRPACDRKYQEFKFCLSLKILHPEEQREVWIARRAEWWAERRLAKSSEDVWDMRDEPINFPKPITEELMQESRTRS